MQKTVEEDRNLYLGGSDIPIIMGISPFKSYYQLLKEKVGIEEPEKVDNPYVYYGNIMEEKIRDYINNAYGTNFVEDMKINEDIRCHVDGIDKTIEEIIEIKTTSKIHKRLRTYKYYLVQLLFYMIQYDYKKGKLCVYERPKDFEEELNPELLTIYDVDLSEFADWIEEINQAIDKYRVDKKRLEENCLLGEEDFND